MGCNTWGTERSSCLIPSVPQHGKRNFTRSETTAHPRVRTGRIYTNERGRAPKSRPHSCRPASGSWPSQKAEWMSQLLPTGPTEAPSHSPSWGAQATPTPRGSCRSRTAASPWGQELENSLPAPGPAPSPAPSPRVSLSCPHGRPSLPPGPGTAQAEPSTLQFLWGHEQPHSWQAAG